MRGGIWLWSRHTTDAILKLTRGRYRLELPSLNDQTSYGIMNSSEPPRPLRPSRLEVGVDGAIHAIAIVAGLAGGTTLLLMTGTRGRVADAVVVAIYSSTLLAMFSCSAAFNLGRWSRHHDLLRRLDQSAICLMIAGSYTPFTVLHLQGAWSLVLTSLVWSIAAVGITIRLLRARLFDRVSVPFYLSLGWIGLVALVPLARALDPLTLILLFTGGALYTIGVVFHRWESLPFQNAIWHAFVLAAAAIHFAATATSIAASPRPL